MPTALDLTKFFAQNAAALTLRMCVRVDTVNRMSLSCFSVWHRFSFSILMCISCSPLNF